MIFQLKKKKMKNIIKTTPVLFLFCLFAAGCLKDKDYDEGRRGNKPDKHLYIAEIEGPQQGFYNVDLIATNSDTTIQTFISIRLASDQPANEDVQVTVALKPALVADYNTKNGTHYIVPASSLYTFPSM